MHLNDKFGWREIEGWFNFSPVYDHIIRRASKNDIIVEIGTWFGKSTCYLAQRAKLSRKNLHIIAVDTFKGDGEAVYKEKIAEHGGSIYGKFIENMTKAGVIEVISPMQMSSISASYHIPNESVFAVFIDGNHSYKEVYEDVRAWLPKVKPGGILAGHDICMPDVSNAVRDALASLNIKSHEQWMGDDGWPSWLVTLAPEEN